MIPILQEIKCEFLDLSQAAAQVKLKKAFGSDEAVKFLLPVRLIVAAFVAAGKIIYAVWQVLTGDISLLDGLKAIGGAAFDFLATPFRWARDEVVGMWNFISGIFASIGHLVTNAVATIAQVLLNLPIISTLRDLFATVCGFFAGDTTFFEAGKKLPITLGEGIWSAVTYPFTMLKNAPHRVLLIFGDLYPGVTCIVRQVKARFFGLFDRDNLLPQRAEVNIVLEEYVDQSVNWSQVRS